MSTRRSPSFLKRRPPPGSTLFPYTTLFRSGPGSPRSSVRRRGPPCRRGRGTAAAGPPPCAPHPRGPARPGRSEEHTSELQSRRDLVCRLLLEKKKQKIAWHYLFAIRKSKRM